MKTVKLIKQHGRTYKGKEYYKYLIVIPNKLIKKLGWKVGEELQAKSKEERLIIEKEK